MKPFNPSSHKVKPNDSEKSTKASQDIVAIHRNNTFAIETGTILLSTLISSIKSTFNEMFLSPYLPGKRRRSDCPED